jgi:hypothetical protein
MSQRIFSPGIYSADAQTASESIVISIKIAASSSTRAQNASLDAALAMQTTAMRRDAESQGHLILPNIRRTPPSQSIRFESFL